MLTAAKFILIYLGTAGMVGIAVALVMVGE